MNELEKRIDCLEWKEEGIRLEYQYVNEIKDKRIYLLKEEIKEKEELQKKIQQLEEELAKKNTKLKQIENSRWWKLRKLIKKENGIWKKNKKK